MEHWTDRIVGDRMTVDQQFTDRVESSPFSRQQWGLVMTAIEFEIENPTDDEAARLVADTTALPSVIPELDSVDEHPMAGPGGPGGPGSRGGGGDGVLGGIKDALGLGGGSDDDGLDEERLATAERLADEYASELQTHLEETGRWSTVRAAAAESDQ
ncbi:DUF5799 family protein [Halorientalis pallida]|uniref:Uncharacterized protein n=1 Tax=Halorientalis pallida TaxID=2479928 RepID=A0A498KW88_9EURY|nr:DUF5799 family protein [Halorientalis pallida]RXK49075.1 hypothetical protein EAF64_09095 [Halorientalis pallida]